MKKDCTDCIHFIDKEAYTCEIEDSCINGFYFEEGDADEHRQNMANAE